MKGLKYIVLGIYFGFILIKSEAVSWYRINEMFHFQSFHLYGVIFTAIIVGILSVFVIKKFNVKINGSQEICVKQKPFKFKANFIGGIIFGLGWSITGACTAPLFIHFGAGTTVIIVPIIFAIFGTYLYLLLEKKLPH